MNISAGEVSNALHETFCRCKKCWSRSNSSAYQDISKKERLPTSLTGSALKFLSKTLCASHQRPLCTASNTAVPPFVSVAAGNPGNSAVCDMDCRPCQALYLRVTGLHLGSRFTTHRLAISHAVQHLTCRSSNIYRKNIRNMCEERGGMMIFNFST